MRRLLPARGIEPFRLTSARRTAMAAGRRRVVVSLLVPGIGRVDIPLLEFRAPGGDVIHSLAPRTTPDRATPRRFPCV